MANRRPNPVEDRLRYVARSHKNPIVLYWTLVAALELEGIHDVSPPQVQSGSVPEPILLAFLDRVGPRLGRNPYDRYLPWLADQVDRVYQSALRDALSSHDQEAADAAFRDADNMSRHLARSLRSIGEWAKAERVDLGRVSARTALRESQVWAGELASGAVPQGEIVLAFDDGFTVQELRTHEQLDAEGVVMQHCVGDYCETVEGGKIQIFSVRDASGKPHVTIEYEPDTREIVQVRGKQNVEPKRAYWPYVGGLVLSLGAKSTVTPPPAILKMVEDAYKNREEIRSDAVAAGEMVDEAVDAFSKGDYESAGNLAEEATRLERSYGDSQATRAFLTSLESAMQDVAKEARAVAYVLEGRVRESDLESVVDALDDEINYPDADVPGLYLAQTMSLMNTRGFAHMRKAVTSETKRQTTKLKSAAENVRYEWNDLDWDVQVETWAPREGEFHEEHLVQWAYDGSTFDEVDEDDPEPGLVEIAVDLAKRRGLVREAEDLTKYVDAYEASGIGMRGDSKRIANFRLRRLR